MKKQLTFSDEKSNKFWHIEQQGNTFTITYGKVGSAGTVQTKQCSSDAEAEKEALKQVNAKLKKGYTESTSSETNTPSTDKTTPAEPQSVAMPDAPKPKAKSLSAPGPDVIDDNSPRSWAAEREDYEDDLFSLDVLRTPEVINVTPKPEHASKLNVTPTETAVIEETGYDEAAFNSAKGSFLTAIKRGRGNSISCIAPLIENMLQAKPSEVQLKDTYSQALKYMFNDDVWALSCHHIDALPIIAASGLNISEHYTQGNYDDDDVKPLFRHIGKANFSAENIAKEIDNYMTALYQKAAKRVIKQLVDVVNAIKGGKQEGIVGTQLPEDETGFMINADDIISIYTAIGRKRLIREDFEQGDDIRGMVIKRYLSPLLKPELEKLADDGVFDDITHGYLWIGLYSDKDAIIERRLDEKKLTEKAAEIEKNLQLLESTDDFIGHTELLTTTVNLYLRNNGFIENKDTDRILALLTAFLYSGEKEPENAVRGLINDYDYLDYPKWRLVFLTYMYANLEYEWVKNGLNDLIRQYDDYQPAKDKMNEWFSDGTPEIQSTRQSDYEEIYGYGGAAKAAHHRDTFTEDDVLLETDTVLARAYSDGYIHIRFKQESEQSYSDTLDWLNALMAKGYSKIHDGYDLRIRFLAEPMFFEAFREMMDGYMWPDNDSHAFFCKAVHYPALRDKVAEFARLTLNEYDRYLNLDGEYSTVAGTFAAVAAAMSDTKYMDVAIQYAEETDGEHEEMASHFAGILEEHWGLTPETAVAIALLTMSYDHDDLGLSKAYYEVPQLLDAVMSYFVSTSMHHKNYKIIRLARNIFPDLDEGSDTLKKVKKLFNHASDPRAKQIYADFYNFYLSALEEEEGDEYGAPLKYSAPVAQEKSDAMDPELPENPPCVITLSEAKKRGFDEESCDHEDDAPWCVVVFAPVTITNPYIYDFFNANRQKRREISPTCYTVRNPGNCYTFGKKVALDLTGAPYQFGMAVYDKKQMAILYGVYDYAEVTKKLAKKQIDLAQMQALKQQYHFMACPQGTPVQPASNPAVKWLDEAHDAISDDRYMRATMKLEKITPEDGEMYDASLLIMAEIMEKKGDKAALKHVYKTALARIPQHADYWQAKLAAL